MGDSKKKELPVGIENFEQLLAENFYYIDKTGLIKELLDDFGKVNLFTRPRRFGKSLNMGMLKNFFETGCRKELFEGLEIGNETEICQKYMGQFPVISISLKEVKGNDYPAARSVMCSVIRTEAMRFQFLTESDKLTDREKRQYEQLVMAGGANQESFQMVNAVLMESLNTLSVLLEKHYGKKVILLVDEYDVPLTKAYENGYYGQMLFLVRNLFEQALKVNDSLYFAVLAGCLRIAKESIFTGLNNLKILSITNVKFGEYFGFTDEEVRSLLTYYGLMDSYNTVKDWYGGYHFGNVDVYCPWDVLNYADGLKADPSLAPQNCWSNADSNDVIRRLFEKAGGGVAKQEIESLVAGGTVTKEMHQELDYTKLYDSAENIWGILFSAGYLAQRGKTDGNLFQLAIPNKGIRKIFEDQIMVLFKENTENNGDILNSFCEALKNGDGESVEQQLNSYLKKTAGISDTFAERDRMEIFCHGILIGMLGLKERWLVWPNAEAGTGCSDIQAEIEDENIGIVIKVKYAHNFDMDAVCLEALEQIEKKGYVGQLYGDGIRVVLKYGIACYQKGCRVICRRD